MSMVQIKKGLVGLGLLAGLVVAVLLINNSVKGQTVLYSNNFSSDADGTVPADFTFSAGNWEIRTNAAGQKYLFLDCCANNSIASTHTGDTTWTRNQDIEYEFSSGSDGIVYFSFLDQGANLKYLVEAHLGNGNDRGPGPNVIVLNLYRITPTGGKVLVGKLDIPDYKYWWVTQIMRIKVDGNKIVVALTGKDAPLEEKKDAIVFIESNPEASQFGGIDFGSNWRAFAALGLTVKTAIPFVEAIRVTLNQALDIDFNEVTERNLSLQLLKVDSRKFAYPGYWAGPARITTLASGVKALQFQDWLGVANSLWVNGSVPLSPKGTADYTAEFTADLYPTHGFTPFIKIRQQDADNGVLFKLDMDSRNSATHVGWLGGYVVQNGVETHLATLPAIWPVGTNFNDVTFSVSAEGNEFTAKLSRPGSAEPDAVLAVRDSTYKTADWRVFEAGSDQRILTVKKIKASPFVQNMILSGTLLIDGIPAPAGTKLAALGSDKTTQCGESGVINPGSYTLQVFGAAAKVGCLQGGGEIFFGIMGSDLTVTMPAKITFNPASRPAFQAGAVQNVDIVADFDDDQDTHLNSVERALTGSNTGVTVISDASISRVQTALDKASGVVTVLAVDATGKKTIINLPNGARSPEGVLFVGPPDAEGNGGAHIFGVVAPMPQGKTITFVVTDPKAKHICIVDGPAKADLSAQQGAAGCGTNQQNFQVNMSCSTLNTQTFTNFPDGVSRTYTCEKKTIDGVDYMTISGLRYSAVAQFADDDNDGLSNSADTCPAVAGPIVRQGCKIAEEDRVTLHTVNLGGGGSTRSPISGATARVFDRNDAAFQALWTKNPSGPQYAQVFENGTGKIGENITDANGLAVVGLPSTGDHLVIVKYIDPQTGTTVYTGLPKGPEDYKDINGDGVGDLAKKDLQIIKVVKKDGTVQHSSGSKTNVTGSLLEIVYPSATLWDETLSQYYYPFIFTSDSDWTADVCATVPAGYKVAGVYDENGNLMADSGCAQAFVNGQTKVMAFDVVDVGSPREFKAKFKLKLKNPNGKVSNLDLDVPTKKVPKGR